jgi:type I restriction enzyme, S subunit
VRSGYKQTDVGVLPFEWDTDTIKHISRQIMDYRGRTPKKLGMDWGGGDIPALSAANVKMGFVDFTEECYFGSESLYSRWMTRGDVEKDDILFTTEAPLGHVALVPDDRKYILSQRTILLQIDKERASSSFLFQMMLSQGFQHMLVDYSSGSTARGIQRRTFERLCVALPPLAEQRAIAAALTDVDALLSGLDRLIAKKRDLKQAAMQQLLTGQTRLPGFAGEWDVKRIGEFTDCTAGGTPSTRTAQFWGGSIRWMSSGELNLKRVYDVEGRITERGLDNSSAKVVPRKSVLIGLAGQGKTRGTVAMNYVELCTNQSIAAVFPNSTFVPEYLYYNLDSRYDELREMSAGDGGRGGLNLGIINAIRVLLPSFAEQTAIAAVLSDMDAELAALEARRDKTRALKQGMMQELLTGKTRLVAPASTAAALDVTDDLTPSRSPQRAPK